MNLNYVRSAEDYHSVEVNRFSEVELRVKQEEASYVRVGNVMSNVVNSTITDAVHV